MAIGNQALAAPANENAKYNGDPLKGLTQISPRAVADDRTRVNELTAAGRDVIYPSPGDHSKYRLER
jgi:hypothetical protein